MPGQQLVGGAHARHGAQLGPVPVVAGRAHELEDDRPPRMDLAVDGVEQPVVEEHHVAGIGLDRIRGNVFAALAEVPPVGAGPGLLVERQQRLVQQRPVRPRDDTQRAGVPAQRVQVEHHLEPVRLDLLREPAAVRVPVVVGQVVEAPHALGPLPQHVLAEQVADRLKDAVVGDQVGEHRAALDERRLPDHVAVARRMAHDLRAHRLHLAECGVHLGRTQRAAAYHDPQRVELRHLAGGQEPRILAAHGGECGTRPAPAE